NTGFRNIHLSCVKHFVLRSFMCCWRAHSRLALFAQLDFGNTVEQRGLIIAALNQQTDVNPAGSQRAGCGKYRDGEWTRGLCELHAPSIGFRTTYPKNTHDARQQRYRHHISGYVKVDCVSVLPHQKNSVITSSFRAPAWVETQSISLRNREPTRR